ncbi:MAG: hypothetical protein E6Q34_12165 [Burkholderiaceae bacterium]|nr:MAG: hypothetical protein E6Q34_12165 [Burkholderiaceae bacterium]
MRRPAFTLLEALVASGIMVLVITGGWSLAKNVLSFNTTTYDGLSAQADLLKVLSVWSNEIRSAAPAETGAFPILAAATNTLTFYSDINDDGVVERVRYFLSGTKIQKGVIVPTGTPLAYVAGNETIIDQVQNVVASATSIFQYYDSSYTGTASSTAPLPSPVSTSAVRMIKINVNVDRNASRPPGAVEVTTQISLRNLKDNQ